MHATAAAARIIHVLSVVIFKNLTMNQAVFVVAKTNAPISATIASMGEMLRSAICAKNVPLVVILKPVKIVEITCVRMGETANNYITVRNATNTHAKTVTLTIPTLTASMAVW